MSAESLEALCCGVWGELERFFRRRIGSSETAAELTQEAFLRLLRAAPVAMIRDPRAYLFRTANNLLIDHHRSAMGRQSIPIEDTARGVESAGEPSPEAVVLSREELAVLGRAIAELPPRGREVFMLHKVDGLSYAEIAERLGIAKNTVIVHMVRSLAHCKRRLDAHRGCRLDSGNGARHRLRLQD
ncbi:MAG TPA: sigma-70 family RNA polymerase sigma factor [Geminicoccaceae bacterium]|nr:sigma-70 family RNA polymerase sigma factor [Geminicoccus sp.]HMU51715.1 sigma-70 family RNA polymerase sigma factor [Geminicoccaceae bacterium]